MSWLRIDDGFAENEKVLDLGDRAFRLHLVGLCYSARNLLDGMLNGRHVDIVCAVIGAKRPARYIEELVRAELWIPMEEIGGYELNDYLEYNPSSRDVKRKRAEAADRQARWRDEHRGPDGKFTDASNAVGDAIDNALGDASRNALRNAAPSHPIPSPKDQHPGFDLDEGKIEELSTGHALRLVAALRDPDENTRRVVLSYAWKLVPADFENVREDMLRFRHSIKSDARWVQSRLKKLAESRAA